MFDENTLLYQVISSYVYIYPVIMSIVWIIGGIIFWYTHERKYVDINGPASSYWPPVTILMPCHNESRTIEVVCKKLASLDYPDYHVLFIDDASNDCTAEILRRYTSHIPIFHLLRLEENQGKAGALNAALSLVSTPLVLVLDADAILKEDGLKWLARSFVLNPDAGAVTGNPIPSNRTNFLSRLQTAEFMSIIGLIRRSQRLLGSVFTVSGCATMFRTDVLKQAGGFSRETATEDVDITWRIQRLLYEIWFEPNALAFIQVPIAFKDYWKQRKRWATGGWHFMRTHWGIFTHWKLRRLWPIYIDFILAYVWAFCFVAVLGIWAVEVPGRLYSGILDMPAWSGAVITLSCIIQIWVAIVINLRYDKGLKSIFFWAPWYPFVFFMFGALIVVQTGPKGLFGSLKHSGKWRSPSRV